MELKKHYEVIFIGGSYAGLSAALALGRSLRNVLIIDSGKPCNQPTPHSHNFLTQDGKMPSEISAIAKEQVLTYDTIDFYHGKAIYGEKLHEKFKIQTAEGITFLSNKLLFATGLKDILPKIKGFKECWGKSIIHCPYCHGYEYKHQKTGILANGDIAFHYAQLISNWTNELTIYTNGKNLLTQEQNILVERNNIKIDEREINEIIHNNGKIEKLIFTDDSFALLDALYHGPIYEQHCDIPKSLGCKLTEDNLLELDETLQTSVEGVYACGDNSHKRSVSIAVSSGSMAGIFINHKLIDEKFNKEAFVLSN